MKKSTTYYISSLKGDNANNGLSPELPFSSLDALGNISINPGDKILLEKGSFFDGQFLHLKSCGDINGQPIEIGCYGDKDRLPVINTMGKGIWHQDYGTPLDYSGHIYKGDVSSAILLYDVENIVIRDIEITNKEDFTTAEAYSDPDKIDRTGVAVVAQNRGTLHSITLKNLFIHDVNGNVYNKHMNNGGIYMTCLKPQNEEKTGIARYDGVTIEGCHIKNVSRWGIAVGYTYRHKDFEGKYLSEDIFRSSGNENILIKENYLKNIGGDAVTPMYALKPLVEHNVSDSCATEINDRYYTKAGKRMGKVAAAIWPWKCKDALLVYNEAVDTKLNQDGMAWDADSGDGTTYKYNYSKLNEGGCVMFCLKEAVNNSFTDNVSYDDLGGLLSPSGNPDAYVANNEFYKRKETPLKRKRNHGKMTLKNNKIIIID